MSITFSVTRGSVRLAGTRTTCVDRIVKSSIKARARHLLIAFIVQRVDLRNGSDTNTKEEAGRKYEI